MTFALQTAVVNFMADWTIYVTRTLVFANARLVLTQIMVEKPALVDTFAKIPIVNNIYKINIYFSPF